MTDPFEIANSCGPGVSIAFYAITGFLLSLVAGHLVLSRWAECLQCKVQNGVRDRIGDPYAPDPFESPILKPGTLGFLERLVFTVGFALFPAAAFGTAGGYVVLKLNANWLSRGNDDSNNSDKSEHYDDWVSGYRMRALILDVASMAFAFFGGLIVGLAPYVDKIA